MLSLLEVVKIACCVLKNRTTTPSGQKIQTLHYYDDYYVDDDGVIEWHARKGHQKRRAQKAQIKKGLMLIAWHPSRWWDWCVPEDKKKETEKLWV